ncbi:hypothetical protein M5K25_009904 [Dendrobium thyrsiflorum]|uniref:Uncharacterized protein n=1 Tax=Dendrobium thyrsiflorum TaxID=117978 RepID=A0ABD0VDM5_DENTH
MAFRDLRYDSCSISEPFPFNEPTTFTLFLPLAATYARFAYKERACLIAKVTISLCRPFRSPSRSKEIRSLPFARAPIFLTQWSRNYTRELIAKALAIDPLLWAAYEELCVLDNDGSCCVFLALVFLTSSFHHDEISKCIIISLNL